MDTKELGFQHEIGGEIDLASLLSYENTEGNSSNCKEETIKEEPFADSTGIVRGELGIKNEDEETIKKGYLHELESFVQGKFNIKVEDEGEDQFATNNCKEEIIKEEHFAESKFIVHGELGIKDNDEETIKKEYLVESSIPVQEELHIKDEDKGDQFTATSSVSQIKKAHRLSNTSAPLSWISTNNRRFHLTEPPVLKCLNCTYQTHNKKLIARHVLNHMEKTLECSHCSYKTRNERVFKQHELVHIPKEQVKLHQCRECSFTSKWQSGLWQHMLRHKKPNDVTWYQCPECPYKVIRRADLSRHLLIHQKDVPMHKCTLCSFESSWKKSVAIHMKHVHGPKDIQSVHCQEEGCSYKTHHQSYLARHIRVIHKCKRFFNCSKCPYQARFPYLVKEHERVHEDRNILCTLCPYKATSTSTLKRHMLVHKSGTEIKWFHCPECPFKTKRNTALKLHKLNHNLNSEIFKCSECSYKSVRVSSFRAHRLVHDVSQWFCCYLCTKKTPRKDSLAKHIQTKHRDSNGRINGMKLKDQTNLP